MRARRQAAQRRRLRLRGRLPVRLLRGRRLLQQRLHRHLPALQPARSAGPVRAHPRRPAPGGARASASSSPPPGCGFDGTCDGNGGCRKHPDGTVCCGRHLPGQRRGGGQGLPGGRLRRGLEHRLLALRLRPGRAGAASAAAPTAASATRATARTAPAAKNRWAPSARAAGECASGSCTDGVCCNLACSGPCVSCNQVGKMGECSPAAAGSPDPHGLCQAEPRASCGLSGTCNGQGGCAKYAAGTECRPGELLGRQRDPDERLRRGRHLPGGRARALRPLRLLGERLQGELHGQRRLHRGQRLPERLLRQEAERPDLRATPPSAAPNFCVDGFCCNSACGGSCVFCGFPGSRGRCTNTPAGVPDPRAACADTGAAVLRHQRQLQRQPRLPALPQRHPLPGRQLRRRQQPRDPGRDLQRRPAASRRPPPPAPPSAATARACGASCANDGQCVAPAICQNGSCGSKPLGALCSAAAECASNFCAQGVCCATPAPPAASPATRPARPAPARRWRRAAPTPPGQCRDEGPTSCRTDGMCDGAGRLPPLRRRHDLPVGHLQRRAAHAGVDLRRRGQLRGGGHPGLRPLRLQRRGDRLLQLLHRQRPVPGAQPAATPTAAAAPSPTAAPAARGPSAPRASAWRASAAAPPAAGTCKSCAVPGSMGTCTNVPAGGSDPQGGCAPSPESSCGNDGRCNGAGACRQWGTSTLCRAASCPAGSSALSLPAFCDGAGTCPASAMQTCAPFTLRRRRQPAARAATATTTARWACAGDGSCGKKALGASCGSGSECGSGNCVDGTCCGSASCGTCESCANAQGTCANVPDEASDPDSCSDETGLEPLRHDRQVRRQRRLQAARSGAELWWDLRLGGRLGPGPRVQRRRRLPGQRRSPRQLQPLRLRGRRLPRPAAIPSPTPAARRASCAWPAPASTFRRRPRLQPVDKVTFG